MAGRQSLVWAVMIASLALPGRAQLQSFLSNRAIAPPTLVFETLTPSAYDGHMFFTPFQDNQPGSLIYDSNGTLVWDGALTNLPMLSHDLQVVDYHGAPHLSFIHSIQYNGYARGEGVILDATYTPVKTIHSGWGAPGIDQHELVILEEGRTAIASIYEQLEWNTGLEEVRWVQTGVFQEIDIATGNVKFQWSSIDHVNTSMSYVPPGSTNIAGDGRSNDTAWDYFHINSIDKDANGDYLISARHVKTIYKISGVDGHIIWKLGGKESDFEMDYAFNFQHIARWRNQTGTMSTISFYDNGADDGAPNPGEFKEGYESYSSGMVASIDTATGVSKLLELYVSPGKQQSRSMGNFQLLPNGNYFMGMGNVPYAVEFTNNATGDGEVAMYAYLAWEEDSARKPGHPSYRNYKFPWKAQPATPPDLFSYSHNCSSPTVVYASWNGATEIDSWRFWYSASASGTFVESATILKSGFETRATLPASAHYVYAEALDVSGNILRKTNTMFTFVPGPALADTCNDEACNLETDYGRADKIFCPAILASPSATLAAPSITSHTIASPTTVAYYPWITIQF